MVGVVVVVVTGGGGGGGVVEVVGEGMVAVAEGRREAPGGGEAVRDFLLAVTGTFPIAIVVCRTWEISTKN